MSVAIWWIRRDLRLSDNQALTAALNQADDVIPVFILDPKLLTSASVGEKRVAFLFEGLRSLDIDLHRRGSALIVRKGDPLSELHILCGETGAKRIFAQADTSPYARRRDERVMLELPLTLTPGLTLHPPESLIKSDGSPYTVFTPFARKWHSLPFPGKPLPTPEKLSTLPGLASFGVPALPRSALSSVFPAGEAEAHRRLDAFFDTLIDHYGDGRNRLDLEGTSRLSPYLRFGMLSTRQAVWAVHEAEACPREATAWQGSETWLNELIWREFYATILYFYPSVLHSAFRPSMSTIQWREDPSGFSAWAEARTGFPVVDAAMRQLNAIGWMHNRARMIAASFLVTDLLIDWRLGEHYFMLHLLDGDPASNNGGWQWMAGTGTDAAPYFRVFNPVLQGKKYDPHGSYVRRWVTELANVPDAFIHTPWSMPASLQAEVGCVIGTNYPAPIVDHTFARQRAMDVFRRGIKSMI